MNRVKKVIKWMAIAILGLLVLAFAGALVQLEIGKRAVSEELAQVGPFKMKKEHPSPLLHNMQALGVKASDIDMLFISHLHLDHTGGFGPLRVSAGPVALRPIPVYAPGPTSLSPWNPDPRVEGVKEPKVLKPGIVENALAINVEGKGIVLIVGCGHQTAERIVERARALFDEPVYAIIGGLHLPVHGGRTMLGPLNLQGLATDRPPWRGVTEADVQAAIEAIKQVSPSVVALSPHDSSDWSIEQFRRAFQNRYRDLKVGRELVM